MFPAVLHLEKIKLLRFNMTLNVYFCSNHSLLDRRYVWSTVMKI